MRRLRRIVFYWFPPARLRARCGNQFIISGRKCSPVPVKMTRSPHFCQTPLSLLNESRIAQHFRRVWIRMRVLVILNAAELETRARLCPALDYRLRGGHIPSFCSILQLAMLRVNCCVHQALANTCSRAVLIRDELPTSMLGVLIARAVTCLLLIRYKVKVPMGQS